MFRSILDARVSEHDVAVSVEDSQVSISPDAFFDHLYSEPTPRMERQRAQLLEALERKGSSDA